MGEEKTYFQVLKDSLRKKQQILNALIKATTEQEQALKSDSSNEMIGDTMLEKIAEKEELLKELENTDQGFEKVYQRVKESLIENKEAYRMEITELQKMIKKITDDSVKLEAMERRNKERLDLFLKKERGKIRDFRMGQESSKQYYQHMANKHQIGQTYFMDHKQ